MSKRDRDSKPNPDTTELVAQTLEASQEVTREAAARAVSPGPDAAAPPAVLAAPPSSALDLVGALERELELETPSARLLAGYLLLSAETEESPEAVLGRARELARQPLVWVTIRQSNPIALALALDRCNLPVVAHGALQRVQSELARAAA